MKRAAPALLAILLLAAALSGCTPAREPAGDGKTLILGFSQLGRESGWRIGNTQRHHRRRPTGQASS